jgi:Uma2 family endonuclease
MAVQSVEAERAAHPAPAPAVPLLQSGDHLTRAEFERRYEAMPQVKKAELIEGVVYVGSPVRVTVHGEPHGVIMTWLGLYRLSTPSVQFGDNATVRLDLDNEPQPDAFLRIEAQAGGRSRIRDGYVEGPPELIVEVAASSVSIDLHAKLRVYRRNGVQEYIAWRVEDGALDWFHLQDGDYVRLPADERGVVESRVFPGLRLLVPALLKGDYAAAIAEQQASLGSAAHRAFIEQLGTTQTPRPPQ